MGESCPRYRANGDRMKAPRKTERLLSLRRTDLILHGTVRNPLQCRVGRERGWPLPPDRTRYTCTEYICTQGVPIRQRCVSSRAHRFEIVDADKPTTSTMGGAEEKRNGAWWGRLSSQKCINMENETDGDGEFLIVQFTMDTLFYTTL